MPTLTVWQGETKTDVEFHGTPLLSAVLQEQGFPLAFPCGGKGVCGKCRVQAAGALSPAAAEEPAPDSRLACRTTLLGDAAVWLPIAAALESIAASGITPSFVKNPMPGRYGLAVDIGTTTLAAALVSLVNGSVLATATAENPQRAIAADVIGRIEAAMAGKAGRLQTLVQTAVEQLRHSLCAQLALPDHAIDQTVITGNTTMLCLLTGGNPEPLSHAPFRAESLFGLWLATPAAPTYLPHCIGAFVGADITCAILAAQLCHRQETALLLDVGTNGEIAMWHKGRLYACATAAGPAFEGGGIEQGCCSVAGAIDRVWDQNGQLACATIGNAEPTGICGSGILDAVATLLRLGLLDETGLLTEKRVPLRGQIAITQKDIRNVQLAKSAIAAGMLTLCHAVGIPVEEVAALYLAGGFGKHINLQNAAAIGLIPQALVDKTKVIGNAALVGAEMLLLQTDFIREIETCALQCEVNPLSSNPVFAENYIQCMALEPI